MHKREIPTAERAGALLAGLALLMTACGEGGDRSGKINVGSPKQAASQLEQAFVNTAPEVKENAGIASEALRNGDYEKAVISLQAVRATPGITLEQGLAIHGSVLTMEDRLIRAMEAGDENAKRAYALLKQMKRR
jgi:hypothetical protein